MPLTVAPEECLVARGVTKRFNARSVLRGLDVDLRAGEILSVVGQNGTGKSTLLRVLAGTLLPDEGQVLIAGRESTSAKARCLVATSYNDDRSWYGRLSAWENLRFWQALRGDSWDRLPASFELLGLEATRDTPVGVLSSGQRARLGVARALASSAPFLVLDEPTRGVDTVAAALMAEVISSAAGQGRTFAIATHDAELRGRLGGRVMTLSFGEDQ